MLVTDDRLLQGRDLVTVCRAAERGGVTAVELRLKEEMPRRLLQLSRELKAALTIPVIVNDRPDVARAAGVWVHVGPDDLPVDLTRRLLPRALVVGASVGTADEAARAGAADYWGVGPWRETSTKSDAGPGLGLTGFRRIVSLAGTKPCVAIGGVQPEDVPTILEAGGTGVAVASGILGAEDIEAAARRYGNAAR